MSEHSQDLHLIKITWLKSPENGWSRSPDWHTSACLELSSTFSTTMSRTHAAKAINDVGSENNKTDHKLAWDVQLSWPFPGQWCLEALAGHSAGQARTRSATERQGWPLRTFHNSVKKKPSCSGQLSSMSVTKKQGCSHGSTQKKTSCTSQLSSITRRLAKVR